MGLDALALYVAFKINFRSAGAYETIDVTPLELVFERSLSAASARSGVSIRPGFGWSRRCMRSLAPSALRWSRAAKASK